jgi:quinoprotein glucose dehydrogenase
VQGIVFVTSQTGGCGVTTLMPASESPLDSPEQTGVTYSEYSRGSGGGGRGGGPTDLEGLDIWKGPDGRIVAYDMNRGEILWVIPNGDAPQEDQDFIRNHPLLQDIEMDESIYNRGRGGHSAMVVSPNLLFASSVDAEGQPMLFAIDKMTGERVGAVEIPGQSRYGMSSWAHDGHQYIIVQLQDGIAAYGLPAAMPQSGGY